MNLISLASLLFLCFNFIQGSTYQERHLETQSVGIDDEDFENTEVLDPTIMKIINSDPVSNLKPLFANSENENYLTATNFFDEIELTKADINRYPRDLLAEKDSGYLEYLTNKKMTGKSKKYTEGTMTREKMKQMLKFENKNVSEHEIVKLIESSPLDGSNLEYLNLLPCLYFEKRKLAVFTAFLRRFRYQKEFSLIFNSEKDMYVNQETNTTTPFFALMVLILKSVEEKKVCDSIDKLFLKVIFETQHEVLIGNETIYLDAFIRSGPASISFLEQYFAIVDSPSKSVNLAHLLTYLATADMRSPELMKKILDLPNFDVNVRVPYWDLKKLEATGFTEKINTDLAFFHALIIDRTCSTELLSLVLKDPKLDILAPTGDIVISYKSKYSIYYRNYHPIFLAIVTSNTATMFALSFDDRFTSVDQIILVIFQFLFHLSYKLIIVILKKFNN